MPSREYRLDVLIHSTGGDALVAWKLMSVLRERFDNVSVLVPYMAFSAATLFSLGADEIVMHPHASLGPIDPQITIKMEDGQLRSFAYEDVGAFLRFLDEEASVRDQAFIAPILNRLFEVVDPIVVGGAKRASELSTDVGERLLQTHMTKPEESTRARSIAEELNKSFFAHADAVSRSRARELHLKVASDDAVLEDAMWRAYKGIEDYMEFRAPFNLLQHFIRNGGAKSLEPVPALSIPPNAPPQAVQQTWQAVLQQAVNDLQNPGTEVEYSLVNAVIESPRVASEFRPVGRVSATRMPGGDIKVAAVDHDSKWNMIPVPQDTSAAAGDAPVANGE